MRKKILAIGSIIVIMIMVATITLVVFAAVSFQDFEGNYTNSYTIDPPADSVIYLNNDGTRSYVATDKYVVFDISNDGLYLSFEAIGGIRVYQLYLKGGEHYRIYSFLPDGVTEASGLVCPLNEGNNVPQISHYGLIQVCTPTTSETTGSTTSETTGSTTSETTGSTTSETTGSTTSETTGSTTSETTSPTTISTSSTTPTTSPTTISTEEFPVTGEAKNTTKTIIGILLLYTAGGIIAFRFIRKKIIKT